VQHVADRASECGSQSGGLSLSATACGDSAASIPALRIDVPVPKQPPHASEESQQPASAEELVWLSAGSIGHPHTCAEACRYIKRNGGCRDGSSCTKCHLCFWRRAGEDPAASEASENGCSVSISAGTRGHPHKCGAPCRYVRRKGGCRDGASCVNCHVCLWQREKCAGADENCAGTAQNERAEVAVPDASFSDAFGQSGKTLRELITVLLNEQAVAQ